MKNNSQNLQTNEPEFVLTIRKIKLLIREVIELTLNLEDNKIESKTYLDSMSKLESEMKTIRTNAEKLKFPSEGWENIKKLYYDCLDAAYEVFQPYAKANISKPSLKTNLTQVHNSVKKFHTKARNLTDELADFLEETGFPMDDILTKLNPLAGSINYNNGTSNLNK
ncbi:hypothetical protein ACFLZV_06680 [Candidatus Margulisiibacteriota bacterium]